MGWNIVPFLRPPPPPAPPWLCRGRMLRSCILSVTEISDSSLLENQDSPLFQSSSTDMTKSFKFMQEFFCVSLCLNFCLIVLLFLALDTLSFVGGWLLSVVLGVGRLGCWLLSVDSPLAQPLWVD